MLSTWITIVGVLLVAYAIGCLNAGYYLVRRHRGIDVRTTGSHGTGATNVGRTLGRRGFVVTLAIDASKGAAAVGFALAFDLSPTWQWSSAIAAAMGHVWPAQLGFRGGRGVAVWIGALAVLDPALLLVATLVTGVAFAAVRVFVCAGLLAICSAPFAAWWLGRSAEDVTGTAMLAVLIAIAHRPHLERLLKGTG
ncbi:MAG: glycerol-3-phosphate acyltransferase [Planctomycetota bacterium]